MAMDAMMYFVLSELASATSISSAYITAGDRPCSMEHTFNEGWDGSFQGAPADIGVYYWQLSITDRFGNEQLLKGDATLIR